MNYANIKPTDVADGPGIRVSLFVSGCSHHCKGCFNAQTWDFSFGEPYTQETEDHIIQLMSPDYIKGLTLLGGEPMEPENRSELYKLVARVKAEYPDKTIWCYTGYLLEDLQCWAGLAPAQEEKTNAFGQPYLAREAAPDAEILAKFLSLIDVVVDGEFMEPLRNLRLQFRGSENQRILTL